MKKHVVLGVFICFFFLCLVGCQNTSNSTVDEQFIESLSSALEARWSIMNDPSNANILDGTNEHKELDKSLVDAELSELRQYQDKEFDNYALQSLVLEYIDLLEIQKNSIQYIVTDVDRYYEMWMPAYDKRTQLIEQFVNNYGLKVSEKHQETLNDMLMDSKEVVAVQQEEAAIEAMLTDIEFTAIEDTHGSKKYQTRIVNTSGSDFVNFSLTINLVDEEDVILETTYASVGNWSNGQKANFEFSTEKEFEAIILAADYVV